MSRKTGTLAGFMTLVVGYALLAPSTALAQKHVLRLRVDGPLLESVNESSGLMAMLNQSKVTTLHEWVTNVRQAAQDPEIDGLVLIIEQPIMSLAQMEEISRTMGMFSAKSKPVYAYLDFASNLSYALASSADHITLAETSEVAIVGLHAELSFYKGLLDKIGVQAEMLHCGAYKSAVEPYTRTEPSAEAAENINWLLDGLFEGWIGMIAAGRDLTPERVKELVDLAPLSAEQALEYKLVDEVSSFGAFKKAMCKQFGSDVVMLKEYDPDEGVEIDTNNPFAIFQIFAKVLEGAEEPTEPGVGLVYVDGAIMVGKSDDSLFGGTTAGSTTVRAALEAARLDDTVKAVVLRVNSPGGSALASDIIWNAATRLASEKPLIVSMGGVAASGGYYVAIPGDTVFAEATTITGSIGVLGGKMVWKELMEDKLGITTTEFSRGRHAGLFSMNRTWNDSEREWITGYINEVYDQFKGRVMESRGEQLKKDIEDLAAGRVFTGKQALELGLVDELGGLSDALALAAKRGGLARDCNVYNFPKQSEFAAMLNLFEMLAGGGDDKDEFEMSVGMQLRHDPLMRAALPLIRKLAPGQIRGLTRAMQDMMILRTEHVGCFAPLVPEIH